MTTTSSSQRPRKVFDAMPKGAFSHPADRRRLRMLKTIPGIEWLTNQLVKRSYEKMTRIQLTANAVQVGANCYAVLDELLEAACEALDIPRPALFVRRDPMPAIRATGSESPMIVVSTGMLDLLTEDEMYCLLAHQASHIHCGHMWYLVVCDFARDLYNQLGLVGTPLFGMRLALEEWRRRAELSCDRGALLVCGDLDMQLGLFCKLAGGGCSRFGSVGQETLQNQAQVFECETRGLSLGKLYRSMMYMDPTLPFSSLRAAELTRWANSEEHLALLEGRFDQSEEQEQDDRPLWGEFAHAQDSGASSPVEPITTPSEAFVDGLKHAADGAAGMMVQGATALQSVVENLLGSLQRPER